MLICEYPQLASKGDTFKLFLKVVRFSRTGSLEGINSNPNDEEKNNNK